MTAYAPEARPQRAIARPWKPAITRYTQALGKRIVVKLVDYNTASKQQASGGISPSVKSTMGIHRWSACRRGDPVYCIVSKIL